MIDLNSSLYVWQNSLVKSCGPALLLVGSFKIINSISLWVLLFLCLLFLPGSVMGNCTFLGACPFVEVFSISSSLFIFLAYSCSSVSQFSHSVVSDSLRPHESQHARPPCPSPNSQSLLKLMPIESVMPSSHLILCRPLLLLPPVPPSIRVFSNESTLHEVPKVLEFRLQHQSFQ